MSAPRPEDEQARLERLESYNILDTAPEPVYEDLCFLASYVCGTEAGAITLIDEHRQWFKAERGLDKEETSREGAFCAHAIVNPDELTVVPDALEDDRFRENPYVQGEPEIRFYAGAPLQTPDGHGLGTICAIDEEPRELTEAQKRALEALGRLVMTQLELRRRSLEFREIQEELEAANEELRRSNRELDRFARVVSHELKDPINDVTMTLDLLDLDLAEELSDDHRELLRDAQNGADRMNELVEDLLRYARVGESETERQRVDPNRLLDQVRANLSRRIEETDAELRVGELPEVLGDPALLRVAFQNLVHNAIKYRGPEPPRIEVEAERENGLVRFSVADNGIGIPAGDQDRLFEVFERASNAGDRPGTGVGLALASRIVERHGGEIGVESEEGEGSTFWFTVPRSGEGGSGGDRLGP